MRDDGARRGHIIEPLLQQQQRRIGRMHDAGQLTQQLDGLIDEILVQMRREPDPIQQVAQRLESSLLLEDLLGISGPSQRLEVGKCDGYFNASTESKVLVPFPPLHAPRQPQLPSPCTVLYSG